jgi:hypothetical protein
METDHFEFARWHEALSELVALDLVEEVVLPGETEPRYRISVSLGDRPA